MFNGIFEVWYGLIGENIVVFVTKFSEVLWGNRVAFLAKGSVFFLLDMYFEVCVHQHAVNLVVSLINCFSFFCLWIFLGLQRWIGSEDLNFAPKEGSPIANLDLWVDLVG